jgi:hypothetical protein
VHAFARCDLVCTILAYIFSANINVKLSKKFKFKCVEQWKPPSLVRMKDGCQKIGL